MAAFLTQSLQNRRRTVFQAKWRRDEQRKGLYYHSGIENLCSEGPFVLLPPLLRSDDNDLLLGKNMGSIQYLFTIFGH